MSYVRWLSNRHDELVTASTDSTLKLWSLSPQPPLQPLSQHLLPNDPGFAPASAAEAAAAAAGVDPGAAAASHWLAGGVGASPASVQRPSFRGAQLIRTFSGHLNERNFVGLTGEGDYLATGSEGHEVVIYHRSLPQPALRFSFTARWGHSGGRSRLLAGRRGKGNWSGNGLNRFRTHERQ